MAKPLSVLIVDDEPEARAGLRLLLADDPEVELVGEASNGRQALDQITRLNPDLVLLDIQMPGIDGFGVLEALAETLGDSIGPLFIFVTAHDEHTLRAFEVHALDYLLKPFTDRRFAQALDRAKQRRRERQAAGLGRSIEALLAEVGSRSSSGAVDTTPKHLEAAGPVLARSNGGTTSGAEPLQRFAVRRGEETLYVDAPSVGWIEAEESYVRLHLAKGRSHLVRGHLGSFEPRLDARRFVRVHRSAIVNLARVERLRHLFQGHCVAVLDDGTEVRVSRGRRGELEARLESFADPDR